jgi:UDP-N-acetyl-alpha-D-muramoyl-L-alanyl-L-glutamate epimerase
VTARFIAQGWSLHNDTVSLAFECDGYTLCETLVFPVPVALSPVASRLLDVLSIVAGVSYAKAFAPTTVAFPSLDVSPTALELIEHTYDHGMREFAFENGMALVSPFLFKDTFRGSAHQPPMRHLPERPLIPFGGGRDSCVVASALRHLNPTLFTVGDNPYARRIASLSGLDHLSVTRTIDPTLLRLNDEGAPNGHVPVTAINSLVSVIVAELTGHTSVVMANEKSASRPTRIVDGVEVNHQYSKSHEYENLLATAVRDTGSAVNYLSVLRHAPDSDISRAFATRCDGLHHEFMSCNRAMIRDASKRSNGWCNDCPKCRGVFLSLAPFLSPARMLSIFGSDLLADQNQIDGFRVLLTDDEKPFECVADVDEARQSLGALVRHPDWSDHVVVRSLQHHAIESTSTGSGEPVADSLFAADINAFLRGTA